MRIREEENAEILDKVREMRNSIDPRLGGRKLHIYFNSWPEFYLGFHVGRDWLFDLLREEDMLIKPRKRSTKTTNSNHRFSCYKNLIKDKTIERPHQVLVSDITYIKHLDDFYYLSLVTDYNSREILGHYLSKDLKAEGTIKALKMAINKLDKSKGVIHHSDRGIQYCCTGYVEVLRKHGMKISMTEEDHVYENALAERVNGILKDEYYLDELNVNYNESKQIVKEVIESYNNLRIHKSLNYITPRQYYINNKKVA